MFNSWKARTFTYRYYKTTVRNIWHCLMDSDWSTKLNHWGKNCQLPKSWWSLPN